MTPEAFSDFKNTLLRQAVRDSKKPRSFYLFLVSFSFKKNNKIQFWRFPKGPASFGPHSCQPEGWKGGGQPSYKLQRCTFLGTIKK